MQGNLNKHIYLPSQREEAIAAVKGGMSVRAVAQALEIPKGTVNGWVRRDSRQADKQLRYPSEQKKAVLDYALAHPDETERSLARRFQMGVWTVGEILRAARRVGELSPARNTGGRSYPPEQRAFKQVTPRLTLEEFLNLLKDLVTQFELNRTKLHELERNVAKWQQLAGNLNQQLQTNK